MDHFLSDSLGGANLLNNSPVIVWIKTGPCFADDAIIPSSAQTDADTTSVECPTFFSFSTKNAFFYKIFFFEIFFLNFYFRADFRKNNPRVARGEGLSNGLRESPTIFRLRPFQYQSNNVESRDPETI